MIHMKVKNRLLRILGWALTAIVALIILVTAVSYLASGPIRDYLTRNANRHMKEYTIKIGKARFSPVWFALALYDVKIIQNAKPDPAVVDIPYFRASVHWKQLLRLHLVGDLRIEGLKVHVDLANVEEEQEKNYPVREEGWQQALQSVYPLKIDLLSVTGADLTYIDKGPYKPLELSQINLFARNIRNIESPEGVYPSSVHLEGVVFEKGKFSLDGSADFLAVPHPTLNVEFGLTKMDLEYFKPLIQRYNFFVSGGLLSTSGTIEYGIQKQIYLLHDLTIEGPKVDFVHAAETAPKEKQVARKTAEKAKELSNEPTVTTEIRNLKIVNGEFGFVNEATDPKYRLFVSDTDFFIRNFSNQFVKGPAEFGLMGKFMGTGKTIITGVFRPEQKGPDFDLEVSIENTVMKSMGDLFSAYGNFAVEGGLFSFYSELKVEEDRINGYVKPMFQDMKVTDSRSKEEKSIFHKLYVGIVRGIKELLENPQERVATQADISGPIEDPRASTWQIIQRLVQNAFFKSILPGFAESF
ncbi:MAG: hypothetical protein CVU64_13435 [Deltaproteobacteria bacterium HGW-Deltaproteobacteria-21]|nr:MAG: hypothetical protein CVU64_13435 [Deltaproteobacteria bacterium HGW-Deltaproteobacteria-21]